MSNCRNSYNSSEGRGIGNEDFLKHLCEYIGEQVTIFTTSGGPSGCGFTGTLLSVNCDFVTLTTSHGAPPANPLSEHICGDTDGYDEGCGYGIRVTGSGKRSREYNRIGSECDIPIRAIASFCHNTI